MTSNRDRAAEIIAPWVDKEWGHPEDMAESAAEALAAAGVLANDLPEPTSHRGDGQPEWLVAELAKIYVDWGLVVFELENPDDEELTSEGAKRLALALLAAADHAETEVTDV